MVRNKELDQTLALIKPDALKNSLTGYVLSQLSEFHTGLIYAGSTLLLNDFVNPADSFFQTHYHGMSVLSCMGGNIPGELIGTAPKAGYWLIRSEAASTEYIIEEDNWVAAAEFASVR